MDVDVQNPSVAIEAGTPNDGDGFGLQPVRQQAKAADGDNHNVVAAVNLEFSEISPLANRLVWYTKMEEQ